MYFVSQTCHFDQTRFFTEAAALRNIFSNYNDAFSRIPFWIETDLFHDNVATGTMGYSRGPHLGDIL
jgi:hypothetical protein